MKKINHSIACPCPRCHQPMQVSALCCEDCDLTLQGRFETHPLMKLDAEMLHFLHVFIMCEGKIADMEKALGISYPTVKNKIQKLKESVGSMDQVDQSKDVKTESLESKSVSEILEMMDAKLIHFDLALALIKQKSERKK